MPEQPEIETGILDEESTGGGTGNEALGLKTEDTRLPTPARQESRRFWLSFCYGHSRD